MKTFVTLFVLIFNTSTFATGHTTGDGGDLIRKRFFNIGKRVLRGLDLKAYEGVLFNSEQRETLGKTLSIDVVKVSKGPLVDNGGSTVNAIGRPGEIILLESFWKKFLEEETDEVFQLVFHEMLRAAGIDDDDYIYSQHIRSFDIYGSLKCNVLFKTSVSTTKWKNAGTLQFKVTGEDHHKKIYVNNQDFIASVGEWHTDLPRISISWKSGVTSRPLTELRNLKTGEVRYASLHHTKAIELDDRDHIISEQVDIKIYCTITR